MNNRNSPMSDKLIAILHTSCALSLTAVQTTPLRPRRSHKPEMQTGCQPLAPIACAHKKELQLECPSLKGELDAEVVEKIAERVWEDHLEAPKAKWSGGSAVAQMMPWKASGAVFGPDANRTTKALALQLLAHLRVCHGAKDGKAFAISAEAMAEAESISDWKRDHYIKARKALVDAGLLNRARQSAKGVPALYRPTSVRMHAAGRTSR